MNAARKSLVATLAVLALAVAVGAAVVYSGAYNVAADDPHSGPVLALLETARERSIATRAAKLKVPADLGDPERIRRGAGNYDAMCTGCHLAPGMPSTEMSRGLYPAPPDLTRTRVPAAEAFWVVKHGVKASGMPAWGKSMRDENLWDMAAFLQTLPQLDAQRYAALVARSEGHSHGGGETPARGHDMAMPADHHATTAVEHRHADGTVESHPAPPAKARTDGGGGQGRNDHNDHNDDNHNDNHAH